MMARPLLYGRAIFIRLIDHGRVRKNCCSSRPAATSTFLIIAPESARTHLSEINNLADLTPRFLLIVAIAAM